MKRSAEIIFSSLMVFVFAFVVYEARDWRIYARLLPWVIGFPMLALAIAQLVVAITRKTPEPVPADAGEGEEENIPVSVAAKRALTMAAYLVGLFFSIWLLGFSPSIPLFTFLYLKFESRESWWFSLLLSALAWVFIIGLFEWILEQPFPSGLLVRWLADLAGFQ